MWSVHILVPIHHCMWPKSWTVVKCPAVNVFKMVAYYFSKYQMYSLCNIVAVCQRNGGGVES